MKRGLAALVTAVGFLGACGGQPAAAPPVDDDRLNIVTTVAPITSIVANVVGDAATISGLVPEGTNSHTFEPPPSVARDLERADVVFVNGLQLEDPTLELAERHVKPPSRIVALGDRVLPPAEYIYDFSFPREEGKPNPHLWTDPPFAKRYAAVVRDTLVEIDGDNAPHYRRNYDAFAKRVDEFDTALRAAFDTIPPEQRKLLTYHDAYAYFARDYGWKVVGAIQVGSFEEPSAREVARLIEQVRAEGVRAVFGSEVFPSPVLEQIGKETGVRYVDVLRDDDLPGNPGEARHSWLGLMHFDFVTIVEALGGDATALKQFRVENVAPDRARYPQ